MYYTLQQITEIIEDDATKYEKYVDSVIEQCGEKLYTSREVLYFIIVKKLINDIINLISELENLSVKELFNDSQ